MMDCPKCGSSVGDVWAIGRKLQKRCTECGWRDEPRIPETVPIKDTKTVWVSRFGGWEYEVFDRYGRTMICSRTYHTEEDLMLELSKEMKRGETDKDAGPYTAVIWQPSVVVKGKILTKKDFS